MCAALAITAAVVRQRATGEGELIDVSLLDSDLALMAPRIAAYLAGEPEPAPSGGTDSVLAVYQPFADRRPARSCVAIGNDAIWQPLLRRGRAPRARRGRARPRATTPGAAPSAPRSSRRSPPGSRSRAAAQWLAVLARGRRARLAGPGGCPRSSTDPQVRGPRVAAAGPRARAGG